MNKGNKRNSIIAVTKLKSIIKRINVLNVLGIKNIGEKLS